MRCPRCGTRLPPDATRCSRCGVETLTEAGRETRWETATIRHRRLPGLFDYAYKLEAVVHDRHRPYDVAESPTLRRGDERAARAALERQLEREGWQPAGRDATGHRRFQRPLRR